MPVISETIWDDGLTTWDGGATRWDLVESSAERGLYGGSSGTDPIDSMLEHRNRAVFRFIELIVTSGFIDGEL